MMSQKTRTLDIVTITKNKRAWYEYFIEQEFDAGLSLTGWEVKSLRVSKVNISNSYVLINNNEAYLFGAIFQPMTTVSSHVLYDPIRNRKLLLNKREISELSFFVNRTGYTIVALSLYWKSAWVKVKIGIAKGKKTCDKRTNIKEREWQRNKARIMKNIY